MINNEIIAIKDNILSTIGDECEKIIYLDPMHMARRIKILIMKIINKKQGIVKKKKSLKTCVNFCKKSL